MKMRPLGCTGLKVSELCLGTMTWGNQNTESEGHVQMDYALESGINFFDTAEMYAVPPSADTYGRTETCIGNWFAARRNRDRVVLATKIAGPGNPWIRNGGPITGTTVRLALEGSLARLKTDYIDLYQLHWPNRPFPHFANGRAGAIDFTQGQTGREEANMLDILQTLEEAQKAGKIRHIGLSNDTPWGLMTYLRLAEKHDLPRVASVQNEFSLLCRRDDPYMGEACVRENVAYLAYSPLGGGVLSGKYAQGARPTGARWSIDHRIPHRDTPAAHAAVAAYLDLARRHGLDPCQMALAFVRQQGFVTAPIIGATNMDQLKINIASADLILPPELLAAINDIHRAHPVAY